VIIVWIVLAAAMLLMLAIFAVILFRKVIAVLQEFSDLVARTAILDGVHRAETEPRQLAVLDGAGSSAARWRELRHDGRLRRDDRRAARLARARRLVDADAAAIEWFRR
jgi:hypothetical protein